MGTCMHRTGAHAHRACTAHAQHCKDKMPQIACVPYFNSSDIALPCFVDPHANEITLCLNLG